MKEYVDNFELNKDVLNNFDELMNIHLDDIESLKITSTVNDSKFYNIIGLCKNVNTIELVGDLKINTNNVITNVFNPNLIENMVFDGVRLPTIKSISKFKNLKSITLRNIKYSSVKGFINNLEKDKIENLIFENTDFCRASISLVKEFKNLRLLKIVNCDNCRFDDYSFFSTNKYLNEVVLEPAFINYDQLSNFVKGKASKKICAQLGKTTKKSLVNHFYMDDENIKIIINSLKLKELSENLNFNRIDELVLILNKNADLIEYMKLLKRVKKEIIISIKDLSYLSVEEAVLLKEQLNIKKINIKNSDDFSALNINDLFDIDDYIEIRKKIDEYTKAIVENDNNDLEKIIKVYKSILYSERKDIYESGDNKNNQLQKIIDKIYTDLNYAEFFTNCLACIGIDSKIIKGKDSAGTIRYWNQVKIYDYWYNLDIYQDAKCFGGKKKLESKPKYFLLNDKEFYKDHKPQSTNYEHCVFTMDKKLVMDYFKETQTNISFISKIIQKIKQIFIFNKKVVEALPAPELENQEIVEKTEVNKYTKEELDLLNQIEDL